MSGARFGAGGTGRSRRDKRAPVDPAQAIQKDLLRYLLARERSVFELRSYLKRRRHDSELIEQAIGEVRELGYVDDCRFAVLFLRDRARLRPASRAAISRDLRAKGVDDDTIAAAFEQLDPPWDDFEMAWGGGQSALASLARGKTVSEGDRLSTAPRFFRRRDNGDG